jgi:hypothetical protein
MFLYGCLEDWHQQWLLMPVCLPGFCLQLQTHRVPCAIDMPPKADSSKMPAAQLEAILYAHVTSPQIEGEGSGKADVVWGPCLRRMWDTFSRFI